MSSSNYYSTTDLVIDTLAAAVHAGALAESIKRLEATMRAVVAVEDARRQAIQFVLSRVQRQEIANADALGQIDAIVESDTVDQITRIAQPGRTFTRGETATPE